MSDETDKSALSDVVNKSEVDQQVVVPDSTTTNTTAATSPAGSAAATSQPHLKADWVTFDEDTDQQYQHLHHSPATTAHHKEGLQQASKVSVCVGCGYMHIYITGNLGVN